MRQLPTECGVGHVTILRLAQKILLTDWSPLLGRASQPLTSALVRVYDEAGNVIETHQQKGDFKEVLEKSGGHP